MGTRRQMRDARRLRSRRIRAILAGGLVLGVGSAATLAAWNDSEYGSATFTAGRFDIVGALDGVTFAQHASSPGGTLAFSAPIGAMMPGNTTYALFSVKTASGSGAGSLRVTAGTPTGSLAAALSYGVRTVTGTMCNATTYTSAGTAAQVVPDGSALSVSALPATVQAVAANGASTVNYCFAVTLSTSADNTLQNASASQTWQIVGTST